MFFGCFLCWGRIGIDWDESGRTGTNQDESRLIATIGIDWDKSELIGTIGMIRGKQKRDEDFLFIPSVRTKGLEPSRRKTPDPKSGAATNYATCAFTPQS